MFWFVLPLHSERVNGVNAKTRFLAQTKSRWEKERERKRKGKEEEGKGRGGKGEREREIGSEALAETEKNRKRSSLESNPGPQQTRLML